MRDATLFTLSAILVVDTLTASAAIGVQTIGWWLLAIVFFLIPSAVITAELGTTYPDQGGIYSWVKRAYGERWASRTTYWYYVNVALWMPAVFLLFTGIFCQLFVSDWADWSKGKWFQVAMGVGLTWLVVAVGSMKLDLGKWVNNAGAVLKVADHPRARHRRDRRGAQRRRGERRSRSPTRCRRSAIAKTYLPVIIFMMLGFELISSLSEEVKRPERIIPRTLFTAGGDPRVPLRLRDDRDPAGAAAEGPRPGRGPRRHVQADLRHDRASETCSCTRSASPRCTRSSRT